MVETGRGLDLSRRNKSSNLPGGLPVRSVSKYYPEEATEDPGSQMVVTAPENKRREEDNSVNTIRDINKQIKDLIRRRVELKRQGYEDSIIFVTLVINGIE